MGKKQVDVYDWGITAKKGLWAACNYGVASMLTGWFRVDIRPELLTAGWLFLVEAGRNYLKNSWRF